jgi:hypothetical protein
MITLRLKKQRKPLNKSSLLTRLSWSLSVTIMLSGFTIIALSLGLTPEHHWTRELSTEIGIAAVSAGIVGFVYEHLLRSELMDQVKAELSDIVDTDARRLGIAAIYESRTKKSDRVKLPDLIRGARKEIMFVGLALYTIINEYRPYLEEALSRGCNVRFLVFDLDSPRAEVLNASLSGGDLIDILKGSFTAVLAFAAHHSAGGKVEVRLYDVVPTFGVVAVDRAEADGRLFVELNCYSSSGDQCPGFSLEKKPNGLFYNYDRQITALWNAARDPMAHVPVAKILDEHSESVI